MENSRNYLLVTACKNEAENLPKLIESVTLQEIRPIVWVIVDDGSTDDTARITGNAAGKSDWIHALRLIEGRRDLGLHYAKIVKMGFDYAISHCKKMGLEYRYLGNLDGDLTLECTFYENLIKEFERDPELGVASGGTKHIIGDRIKHAKVSVNEPSGGHMLIRRGCFEECGGIPFTTSVDSVIKAKARLRGWKTRRFEENIATEIRDTRAAEGYWKGYILKGKHAYYVNLNPIHVIAGSLICLFKRPGYTGIPYLFGYFTSFISREKQIDDEEVKRYFWNKWKMYLRIFK